MQDPASLFPPLEPYDAGELDVGDGHKLYFEQCGNPSGRPVVLLHGGPGGGCSPKMRRFHDPKRYRIVLFDQRGAGRSTPAASLIANTTWHLVADIERLREKLGIERWQVFGGSWGSTLALAYAEKHPDRVTELVLRGIFMLRRFELEWFYQRGASLLYPDAFAEFQAPIPEGERADMMSAYYRRLTGEDAQSKLEAARAWSVWEATTSFLRTDAAFIDAHRDAAFALAFARIEAHYFVHGGFFDADDQLLRDADRLADIPGTIVHGALDVVCPPVNAFDLHRAWPKAERIMVADAGHSAFEPGISAALVAATNAYA